MNARVSVALFACAVFFLCAVPAVASETNGTIDVSNKYARLCLDSSCTSYTTVNFAPTINSNTPGAATIAITDSGITGNAWGEGIGWINMRPTGYGVSVNANTGALSGYAYSMTGGWINFNPTGGGVSINSSGQFTGWAWVSGSNGGWLRFSCSISGACVQTDWRPVPNRSSSGSGGGGGGVFPQGTTTSPTPVTPPPTNPPPVPVPTPTPTPNTGELTPLPESLPTPPINTDGTINTDRIKFEPNAGSTQKPSGLPKIDLSHVPLASNQPVFFTTSGSVQVFSPLRTITTKLNGKTTNVQGKFFEQPSSGKIRMLLPTAVKPVSVQTRFRYIGEAKNDSQRIVYIRESPWNSFWYRLMKLFLLAVEYLAPKAAFAAETSTGIVYEDYVSLPEKPGVYQVYVTVEYADKKEVISNYGVVITNGKVFYKQSLFFGYEKPVTGAKITLEMLDPVTRQGKVWHDPQDENLNPTFSDKSGLYSFVVPSGVYATTIEASGFDVYQGHSIGITNGEQVVNESIELVCLPWSDLFCQWDSKLLLLFVISMIAYIAYYAPRHIHDLSAVTDSTSKNS